jgi:Glyoxalase-like domain
MLHQRRRPFLLVSRKSHPHDGHSPIRSSGPRVSRSTADADTSPSRVARLRGRLAQVSRCGQCSTCTRGGWSTALDCTDARVLAEFYRRLLGWRYRPADQPPATGEADPAGQDWLVRDASGSARMAFQQVAVLPEATWPEGPVPQQMHVDLTVPTTVELDVQRERALTLGARLLHDRSDDPEEPLRVYADPAGHPSCIFVAT